MSQGPAKIDHKSKALKMECRSSAPCYFLDNLITRTVFAVGVFALSGTLQQSDLTSSINSQHRSGVIFPFWSPGFMPEVLCFQDCVGASLCAWLFAR